MDGLSKLLLALIALSLIAINVQLAGLFAAPCECEAYVDDVFDEANEAEAGARKAAAELRQRMFETILDWEPPESAP